MDSWAGSGGATVFGNRSLSIFRTLPKPDQRGPFLRSTSNFGGSWYDLVENDFWDNGKYLELHCVRFRPAVEIKREIRIPDNVTVVVLDLNDYDGFDLSPESRRELGNSLNMIDRCIVLGSSGAKTCVNVSSCPLLRNLSKRPGSLQGGLSRLHVD
jgi:hypothetical protein